VALDVDSQHPYCLMCVVARVTGLAEYHEDCTGRDGLRWCCCLCSWLYSEITGEDPP
jgi:hypothetical protein